MKLKIKDNYNSLSPEDPQSSLVYLKEVLKLHNIDITDPERQIAMQWRNIAGNSIADISVCNGVKNGTLYVQCSNASQASLVRLNKREILKKISSVFPELNVSKIDIRF